MKASSPAFRKWSLRLLIWALVTNIAIMYLVSNVALYMVDGDVFASRLMLLGIIQWGCVAGGLACIAISIGKGERRNWITYLCLIMHPLIIILNLIGALVSV